MACCERLTVVGVGSFSAATGFCEGSGGSACTGSVCPYGGWVASVITPGSHQVGGSRVRCSVSVFFSVGSGISCNMFKGHSLRLLRWTVRVGVSLPSGRRTYTGWPSCSLVTTTNGSGFHLGVNFPLALLRKLRIRTLSPGSREAALARQL